MPREPIVAVEGEGVTALSYVMSLLEHWRGRPFAGGHADVDEAAFEEWSLLVEAVEQRFVDSNGTITPSDAAWIEATRVAASDDYRWAHAVAWGIDLMTWQTFPSDWQASLSGSPSHTLSEGELFPVSDWLPTLPEDVSRSTRPSAEMTYPDELPHVRRWSRMMSPESAAVDVIFHFDASAEVLAAGEATAAAAIHANATDEEFTKEGTTSIFPVRPSPPDQADRVVTLLRQTSIFDVGIAVGGEVSLTEDVLDAVQDWMNSSWTCPGIVVPGSIHTTLDGGEPVNLAFALRRRGERLQQRKVVPFEKSTSTKTAPKREGITPGPRVLNIWVGGWARFAMLICKDALDPALRRAAIRAGVNLLAIPTFSEDTSGFAAHVGSQSLLTQGRVVMANNPARFDGEVVSPLSVFGQPVSGRLTVTNPYQAGSSGQGVAVQTVGKTLEWIEKS